jgi:hypothetical protein
MQAVTPLMIVNDFTRAWTKLLEVLGEYPASARIRWVRDRTKWVISKRLAAAPSPIAEARELCRQIEGSANARQLAADIWAEVVLSKGSRRRVSKPQAAYAATKAIICAPLDSALLGQLGSHLLRMSFRGDD